MKLKNFNPYRNSPDSKHLFLFLYKTLFSSYLTRNTKMRQIEKGKGGPLLKYTLKHNYFNNLRING